MLALFGACGEKEDTPVVVKAKKERTESSETKKKESGKSGSTYESENDDNSFDSEKDDTVVKTKDDKFAGTWYCADNGCSMTFYGSEEYGYRIDVEVDGASYVINIKAEEIDGNNICSEMEMWTEEYEYFAYYYFTLNGDSFTFLHQYTLDKVVIGDSGVYRRK